MKLRHVDPNKIVVPDVRVTARMDEETDEQFKASVKTVGIDEPIKCFEVDGQLILSDGLHRLVEAIRNKINPVDVYVREGTMVDVLCNNLMSGHLRGKHPPGEMMRSIELLWKEYQMDSEKIAAKTGLTRDYVEKLQRISELTPLVRAGLDSGEISVGHADALTKLKDPVRQETVFQQLRLYRWPVRELEAYIQDVLALLKPPKSSEPPKELPPPPKIKCFYCGAEGEPGQIANPNTCRECASIMIMSIRGAAQPVTEDKSSAAPPP